MLGLRDLQAAFADHLAGCERGDLAALVTGGRIPPAARLAVHRRHVRHSLSAALAATFPTVQTLVGADFFARLAGDFIIRSLPSQPVLSEYGAGFPCFVSHYPPAAGLPYLADIARLDWALNTASHAGAVRRLTTADLAAVAVEQLPAHGVALPAGACLLRSIYPLDRIWQASQPGAAEDPVALDADGCRLLVLPDASGSFFARLTAGEAALVAALRDGGTLEAAAGAAFDTDAGFDLSKAFAGLLALGAFAALQ